MTLNFIVLIRDRNYFKTGDNSATLNYVKNSGFATRQDFRSPDINHTDHNINLRTEISFSLLLLSGQGNYFGWPSFLTISYYHVFHPQLSGSAKHTK